MSVSIKDIAKALNINPSTVSRALQGVYGVNEETRRKIRQTAKEMGYVPNIGARELVKGKTNLVGIFIGIYEKGVRPPFFETLPLLNQTLGLYGKETIILSVDPLTYKKGQYMEMCRSRGLEGSIVMGPFDDKHLIWSEVSNSQLPSVVFDEPYVGRRCTCIGTFEEQGAYDAVNHLLELGHRKIGLVNGFPDLYVCRERFAGYRRALDEAGILFKSAFIRESDFSGAGGAGAARELLKREPEITAIFFTNDLMAMGAISALQTEGISVPRDVSVVGFDGLFIGEFYNPPLTTVQLNDQLIGIRTAEALMELIAGGTGKEVRMEASLVRRASAIPLSST
jgi:LacI family transcriptional regulator